MRGHNRFHHHNGDMSSSPLTSESSDESESVSTRSDIPFCLVLIVLMEFCERFSYYGIKTILFEFFSSSMIQFSATWATVCVHLFTAVAYAAPVLGAYLADGSWGKYTVITRFSFVYSLGCTILCFATCFDFGIDFRRLFSGLGLILISIGTGGIKPCVSAFGADQLIGHQDHTRLVSLFFSVFYVSINLGALFSTILSPSIRSMPCLGQKTCYPVAFGVPAAMMLVSTIVFLSGRHFYRHFTATDESPLAVVARVLKAAWNTRFLNDHWTVRAIDADLSLSPSTVGKVARLVKVGALISPLPLFWALYDQMGTRWVKQAEQMDPKIGFLKLAPDHMQALNTILVICIVPLSWQVYSRVRLSLLSRMILGMILAALAFFMAAIVQLRIDSVLQVSILWQIPQYILITAAEVLFSVSGLEFTYKASPQEFKSVAQAMWLMTVSIGNIATVLVAMVSVFSAKTEFVLFAIGLLLAALIFRKKAKMYQSQ